MGWDTKRSGRRKFRRVVVAPLKSGDLVCATNHATEKLHIVEFGEWKEGRQDTNLMTAEAICGVKGMDAHSIFYWHPAANPERWGNEDRCRRCFQMWRAKDRPTIIGYTDEDSNETPDVWLPFSWKEIPAIGHPWDKTRGYDPATLDEKQEAEKSGAPQKELRRWERGRRYVRLMTYEGPDEDLRYGVHYGVIGDVDSDESAARSTMKNCLHKVQEILCLGGSP